MRYRKMHFWHSHSLVFFVTECDEKLKSLCFKDILSLLHGVSLQNLTTYGVLNNLRLFQTSFNGSEKERDHRVVQLNTDSINLAIKPTEKLVTNMRPISTQWWYKIEFLANWTRIERLVICGNKVGQIYIGNYRQIYTSLHEH